MSLQSYLQETVKKDTLESIEVIANQPIKLLLLAVWNAEDAKIQPLYTAIAESSDAEVTAFTAPPGTLLCTLLTLAISRRHDETVKQILAISPLSAPSLSAFLAEQNKNGASRSIVPSSPATHNTLWSLLLNNGFFQSERQKESAFYALINKGQPGAPLILQLLVDHGYKPDVRLAVELLASAGPITGISQATDSEGVGAVPRVCCAG